MATLESINIRYIKSLESKSALQKCRSAIVQEPWNKSLSSSEVFLRVMDHIDLMYRSVGCSKYPRLADAITLGITYRSCIIAVNEYRNALLLISKSPAISSNNLVPYSNNIKKNQAVYDDTKKRFTDKYDVNLGSEEQIIQFIKDSIDDAMRTIDISINADLKAARAIVDEQVPINLAANDPLPDKNELPNEIIIGRYYDGTITSKILQDLGIKKMYHTLAADIRNAGNIIVSTDYEHLNDDAIDSFVIAYIFRYIEQFPTGAVNVHIFDKNSKYVIRSLFNGFQRGNYGDGVKRVIQLHSEMMDLSVLNNVVCEDIIRKMSVSQPDLFSLYDNDQSDAFNLIVLKDGLVEVNGSASTETLEIISSLIKINDVGHKSGFRFLIIDNSSSVEKGISPGIQLLLKSIRDNCQIHLEYSNGQFQYGKHIIDALKINDKLDSFVENRSKLVADLTSRKEKSYISLKDLNTTDSPSTVGSIMYIPVGKAGQETIELPFSCKDEDGTVAGQCIGYMAIGQSGSGKSSFFHSIVLNGCLRYSPMELQFWLLDFKFGGASSKYRASGLPHIRIIAENNKVDDALCLFQMITEEMDRRNKAFNANFVDNIVDYNKIASQSDDMEYFPRIIIAIDEIQEIFRDDSAAVLQKQISAISVRMRSAGMHFVMVAQNLSDGKSYMLKEAFLPSASGRICFRVTQNIPRDSGFDEDFIQRKEEIAELKTGEAYISYGKGTIRKVKIAYASAEDMIDVYFQQIRNKYPAYAGIKPLVIGSKIRLSIGDDLQRDQINYEQVISQLRPHNGSYDAIIAEDSYRMEPMKISFSQLENSSLLFLGNDKRIASVLCATTAASLIQQNLTMYLFNGDRTLIQENDSAVEHPFLHVCKHVSSGSLDNVKAYRLNQFSEILKSLYVEFLKRQKEDQEAEDIMPNYDAIFLIVNDLFGIESFVRNDTIENGKEDPPQTEGVNKYDFLSKRVSAMKSSESGQFRETVQNIVATLVQSGFRYNIHLVLGIRGEPSTWRNSRLVSEINNIILFNPTQFVEYMHNTYYLREMLKNISNENSEETMAVSCIKHHYSKIRPIMISMADQKESMLFDKLLGGASHEKTV